MYFVLFFIGYVVIVHYLSEIYTHNKSAKNVLFVLTGFCISFIGFVYDEGLTLGSLAVGDVKMFSLRIIGLLIIGVGAFFHFHMWDHKASRMQKNWPSDLVKGTIIIVAGSPPFIMSFPGL